MPGPSRLLPVALTLALIAGPAVGSAQAEVRPVAAGSVVVRKNPGNSVGASFTTDRDGRVSGPVRVEAGAYQVTVVCPPRVACRLASVSLNGRALNPDARGRFAFPVAAGVRTVRLEARVVTGEPSIDRTPGPRAATRE